MLKPSYEGDWESIYILLYHKSQLHFIFSCNYHAAFSLYLISLTNWCNERGDEIATQMNKWVQGFEKAMGKQNCCFGLSEDKLWDLRYLINTCVLIVLESSSCSGPSKQVIWLPVCPNMELLMFDGSSKISSYLCSNEWRHLMDRKGWIPCPQHTNGTHVGGAHCSFWSSHGMDSNPPTLFIIDHLGRLCTLTPKAVWNKLHFERLRSATCH